MNGADLLVAVDSSDYVCPDPPLWKALMVIRITCYLYLEKINRICYELFVALVSKLKL